jgi:plastocyanin domain-containing protein/YHS domain-containing protein
VDILLVDLLGAAIIVWIVWYFFLSRQKERGLAAAGLGFQEINVTVKGGYRPQVLVARGNKPLRIHFRREETSPCSEEVVFPDFGIRRFLPAFETTTVEIPASPEGTYPFMCGMDMLHGSLVLGEGSRPVEPESKPVAVDPVCHMRVDPDRAAATTVKNGETLYFCSTLCRDTFDRQGA